MKFGTLKIEDPELCLPLLYGNVVILLYGDWHSVTIVRPCLDLLGLVHVESVHGQHSTKLIGHLPLINHYEPSLNVVAKS